MRPLPARPPTTPRPRAPCGRNPRVLLPLHAPAPLSRSRLGRRVFDDGTGLVCRIRLGRRPCRQGGPRGQWPGEHDDGDGVREVQPNRIEGFWLRLRNHFRPFRRVSKWRLDIYLAFYRGMHNHRRDAIGFHRRLSGPVTPEGT